ncbi:unnamed protein product [Calypogeia fissa]
MVVIQVLLVLFGSTYLVTIPAAISNFTMQANSYSCSSNVICLGQAHNYTGNATDGLQVGMISLVTETLEHLRDSQGQVYYSDPVRLLDPSTEQAASFATTFKMYPRPRSYGNGDGMTFVISADNSTLGEMGGFLGIFDSYGATSFKTIVVEFDGYQNSEAPFYDIDANHVSFGFSNITTHNVTASASTVNVFLWDNNAKRVWVEYSWETRQLEVRVSYNESRPTDPLLKHGVDLFDVVEEYMWVGFSGANYGLQDGRWLSNYYVGDWTFQSYGIAAGIAPSGQSSKKSNGVPVGLKLGVSVGVPTSVAVLCIIVFFLKRRFAGGSGNKKAQTLFPGEDPIQLDGMPERFSYQDLSLATRGFEEESKLGTGGFGSVYRGVLPSTGIQVAVKKVNTDSTQGEKEFMAEVCIINLARHKNLIQLRGWCRDASKKQYLLVYELMSNGSLDKWLFRPAAEETAILSWPQRFNIVTGIAAAMEYLHHGCPRQVIHRDIKSSNIMLDKDWNAKLGDFGLARLVDHEKTPDITLVAGTFGYIAPEVAASGRFTDKADIFAFGAVVLEVACGRKALLARLPPEEIILVDWVWGKLSGGDLLSTVDKRLKEYDTYWMEVLLGVGLLCSHPNPLARPSMKQISRILAGEAPLPSVPTSKPELVFSSDVHDNSNFMTCDLSWLNEGADRSLPASGSSLLASVDSPISTGESTCMYSESGSSLPEHSHSIP